MDTKEPSIVIATNGQVYCDAELCEFSKLYKKTILATLGNCDGKKCPLGNLLSYVAKGVVTGVGACLAQNFEENLHIIVKTLGNGTTDFKDLIEDKEE